MAIDIKPARPDELPESLLKLMRREGGTGIPRIWRALSDEDRKTALRVSWERGHEGEARRRALVDALAKWLNFRTKTVRGRPLEKLVEWGSRAPLPPPLITGLFADLHVLERTELTSHFLDQLGIAHTDGDITKEAAEARRQREWTEEEIHTAAESLRREQGYKRCVVYFLVEVALNVPYAEHLRSWMRRVAEPQGGGLAGEELADSTSDLTGAPGDAGEIDHRPEGPPLDQGLTTLDRLLVDALDHCAREIVGSRSEDEIDDAVDELLQLNAERPQSRYHEGLRDVVFSRSVQAPDDCRTSETRWYWAGAIRGYADAGNWAGIAEAHEAHEEVRGLGDGSNPEMNRTAERIVDALRHEGLEQKIAGLLRPKAFTEPGGLFAKVKDVGSALLHEGNSAAAYPIFELLMEGVKHLQELEYGSDEEDFFDVRRRWAHCLQQQDRLDRARAELTRLREERVESGHLAMIDADLGLLDGKFNRLRDVELPADRDGIQPLVERLEKGREMFESATQRESRYSAHGHYCLGVLELARSCLNETNDDRASQIAEHFAKALRTFGRRPASYDGVFERAEAYRAIARIVNLGDEGEIAHAARTFVRGFKAGIALPLSLIQTVVASLDAARVPEALSDVVEALVEGGNDEHLELLGRLPDVLKGSEPTAEALVERAVKRGPTEPAAGALRGYLPVLLEAGHVDLALNVLDRLEVLAVRGAGEDEFVALLEDPARYQPAWDVTDATVARVRLLESRGAFSMAATLLSGLGFELKAAGGDLADVRGILATLGTYPIAADEYEPLTKAMEAAASAEEADAPVPQPAGDRPIVRVLFVGGDERQAKQQHKIEQILGERASHVRPTFIFSGWNGGWYKYLEQVKSVLDTQDVVVLMRFMRTEFGKQVRKLCGSHSKQWRSCWAPGRNAIADAIIEAANAVPPAAGPPETR